MPVRVFVSWSGDKSLLLAEKLVEWLPTIVPAAHVFYSPDIGGGDVWFQRLYTELRSAQFGIVCVSKESSRSQWLHFELGALWRHRAGRNRNVPVFPLLLDIAPRELTGPLALLQAKQFSESVFRELCAQIAKKTNLSDERFGKNFKAAWGQIQSDLSGPLSLGGAIRRRRAA